MDVADSRDEVVSRNETKGEMINVVSTKEVTSMLEETDIGEEYETIRNELGGEEKEERERGEGGSVVETAAATDAVGEKVDPTKHHPLVIVCIYICIHDAEFTHYSTFSVPFVVFWVQPYPPCSQHFQQQQKGKSSIPYVYHHCPTNPSWECADGVLRQWPHRSAV